MPTARALSTAVAAAPGLPVIASGGLTDGVDAAKCLALGAAACGLARPLLIAAQADRAGEALATLVRQLRIAVWACGAPSAEAMSPEVRDVSRVVVIGAGLGGLGAALRLQGMGHDVTVLEQRADPAAARTSSRTPASRGTPGRRS